MTSSLVAPTEVTNYICFMDVSFMDVVSDLFMWVNVNPDIGREVLTPLVLVGDLLFPSTVNSVGEP